MDSCACRTRRVKPRRGAVDPADGRMPPSPTSSRVRIISILCFPLEGTSPLTIPNDGVRINERWPRAEDSLPVVADGCPRTVSGPRAATGGYRPWEAVPMAHALLVDHDWPRYPWSSFERSRGTQNRKPQTILNALVWLRRFASRCLPPWRHTKATRTSLHRCRHPGESWCGDSSNALTTASERSATHRQLRWRLRRKRRADPS